MSTVVTQAEFCATTVTQTDYSISAASSAVSPNDFRRAWITPHPENLPGLAEKTSIQNQYAGAKLTVADNSKLSLQKQLNSHQKQQQPHSKQTSIDHDDEVALHPLSNQVKHNIYINSFFFRFSHINENIHKTKINSNVILSYVLSECKARLLIHWHCKAGPNNTSRS